LFIPFAASDHTLEHRTLEKMTTYPGGFSGPDALPEEVRSFLAAMIESSEDAIISKDLNGIISSWNEGAQRIFGYTATEIIGQSILRLIPPDLHSEEEQILAKLRAGERIEHYETTRIRRNGERFPISISIFPMRDGAEMIIGASKIGKDTSERSKDDESHFRLAAIVDNADDAIISKNLNGIIASWNRGAFLLFGYTEDEMIGQSILRLIPEELHYEEDEILRKLRAGEKIEHYETTRLSKTGELLDVSVTISPIRNSTGEIIGASKIARNISDRKKMEKVVVQSEKLAATGRMAAAIAHEINNPLASVMNLIFLARQDHLTREEVRSYLATAESELERVSHIARQTLGYYRDTGSPTEVYLHDLMENVLSVYRSKLLVHNISVESKFNDLRKIKVRSGEIVQVFSNLVSNAIDAMPQAGTLSISMSRTMKLDGDGVQTIISDTGCGISRENLGRVFEPFFTTKGNLGTGIGLWVAKQLIERNGGQISISSAAETRESGTVVTIYLPFPVPEDKAKRPNGSEPEN
jgi:PAS domain S-box-containing protein